MHHDLLDAHLLHGAALLAVGVPPHVKLPERDLHDLSADADLLVVAVCRRQNVTPVDQRAPALVLDAAVELEMKNDFFHLVLKQLSSILSM